MSNTIVRMVFGSHLYGLNTPESDMDYKGIFLPDYEDVLLGRIPKSKHHSTGKDGSKNTSEDIDEEMFSIQYFVKLACQGQTVALDMLHAPDNMILESSYIWEVLVAHKRKFYSKNLTAFVGYARRQASKYGIKGSRLNTVREVLAYLNSVNSSTKLRELWDELPRGEHIHFLDYNIADTNQFRIYQVIGKKFLETVKVESVIDSLTTFEKAYGDRAKLAAENKGIDWKALSHALRAALQIKELLTDHTITFPLKDAEFLKLVKQGKLDYVTMIAPTLEELMEEVEELTLTSTLPEKVDTKYWDEKLITLLKWEYT